MAAASEADWCFSPFLFNEQWEQEEGPQRCSGQTCSGRQESPAAPTDGAAPTQTMTPVGMAALAEAALTHRHVGIHRCIPHPSFHGGQPVLARAPPRLNTPGRCPPLPARTFLGRCTEIVSFPPVTGSASGPGSARGKQWIGPISCARALCLHRQFPPQQTERGCPGVIPAFRWLRIERKLVTARIQPARPTWAAWRGEGVQVGGEEEEEELWPPFLCGTWRSGSRERETCLITGQTIVSSAI